MDSVSILHKTVLETELKTLDITIPELRSSNMRSMVELWLRKRLKQLEQNDD